MTNKRPHPLKAQAVFICGEEVMTFVGSNTTDSELDI